MWRVQEKFFSSANQSEYSVIIKLLLRWKAALSSMWLIIYIGHSGIAYESHCDKGNVQNIFVMLSGYDIPFKCLTVLHIKLRFMFCSHIARAGIKENASKSPFNLP